MSAATSAGAEYQPPVSIDNAYKTERLNELARRVHQGSAHAGLAIVAEDQADNLRLAVLERRDEAEQRLLSQTEERCTYVHCKTCNYRAWKAADVCRTQNHSLVYLKGTKRYFRCRNCSKRTTTFERYPSVCCRFVTVCFFSLICLTEYLSSSQRYSLGLGNFVVAS
ncbi:unnamed protein product [Dicrocoelium dendriticum]|nr:unnamed protein product [Dicrocoelium dendriticum]